MYYTCVHTQTIYPIHMSKSTRKHLHSSSIDDELPILCYTYLSSLQTKTQKQAPCRKADFRGRASKAQDESGTIYSARNEMHREPDRSMINGYSSQFKDVPLTKLGTVEITQKVRQ